MSLEPNLQPGLKTNAQAFEELSSHAFANNDGVLLKLPPKPIIRSKYT